MFRNFLVSEKLWKGEGEGESNSVFIWKICPTLTENFIGNPSVFEKFSGLEKFNG